MNFKKENRQLRTTDLTIEEPIEDWEVLEYQQAETMDGRHLTREESGLLETEIYDTYRGGMADSLPKLDERLGNRGTLAGNEKVVYASEGYPYLRV